MSNPPPSRPMATAASRYAFMLLVGVVAGAIGTVMAVRAIQARQDPFHESVMHVQQWHLKQLQTNVQQSHCTPTDTLPHLKALRVMADDLEPAFPDLRTDARYVEHASHMRATLDTALASPPLDCQGVSVTAQKIGDACKACHQDFRN